MLLSWTSWFQNISTLPLAPGQGSTRRGSGAATKNSTTVFSADMSHLSKNKNAPYIWAAAFICSVAPVKKIYGVPPPRFNLVSQVLALFHHDWSRFPIFDINMFKNMMYIKQNLSRFWNPPISFWFRFAGETNISSNPAWRHIFFSSK